MEFTGELENVTKDYKTDKIIVSISINEKSAFAEWYEKFKDCGKLKIIIDKFRKKRSLDANAYSWSLITKMATLMNVSKDTMYIRMLREYGTEYFNEDGTMVLVHVEADKELDNVQGVYSGFIESYFHDGVLMSVYRLIKGTSLYDSLEMSKFINGVVSECQDLKIPTVTPEELRKMKERWHV